MPPRYVTRNGRTYGRSTRTRTRTSISTRSPLRSAIIPKWEGVGPSDNEKMGYKRTPIEERSYEMKPFESWLPEAHGTGVHHELWNRLARPAATPTGVAMIGGLALGGAGLAIQGINQIRKNPLGITDAVLDKLGTP